MDVPADREMPRRWRLGSAGAPPAAAGTYVLVLRSRRSARLPIGRLGVLALRPGHYLYVGSAFGLGGLAARVARHLRADKPRHWHLDYLRPALEPLETWWRPGPVRLEHRWALALCAAPGISVPLAGFGASDCRCPAHLFAARSAAGARRAIAADIDP